jgi:phenylpropionate dioxygenase-like ring-hydroxylating dioxygenase large terminal subunit
MGFDSEINKFGRNEFIPQGWYWLLRADEVKTGRAQAARFLNQDFAVYRGDDGKVRIFEAFCPHMGAHLGDGMVEGNSLRCPFHYWKFDEHGVCSEVPADANVCKRVAPIKTFRCDEKYGLIWLWLGPEADTEEVPVIPELKGLTLNSTLGNAFTKECHPNVMMINAIDAQHFRSVHDLVVDLDMKSTVLSPRCIQFSNQTPLPQKNLLLKFASHFYSKSLTYEMTYWWGHTGSVMVGPDFLHFYIIFALRPTTEGKAEGQTILVTKARPGLWGALVNPVLLFLTKLVGNYFAKGDTIIFSRIRFKFKTPIKADRAILDFVRHYESQKSYLAKESTCEFEPRADITV